MAVVDTEVPCSHTSDRYPRYFIKDIIHLDYARINWHPLSPPTAHTSICPRRLQRIIGHCRGGAGPKSLRWQTAGPIIGLHRPHADQLLCPRTVRSDRNPSTVELIWRETAIQRRRPLYLHRSHPWAKPQVFHVFRRRALLDSHTIWSRW